VRFLVDANLSPRVLPVLQAAGHTVTHVFDVGLGNATDEEIRDHARRHGVAIVCSDTDFGALLARYQLSTPSFVLLRRVGHLDPEAQAELLLGALSQGRRRARRRGDRDGLAAPPPAPSAAHHTCASLTYHHRDDAERASSPVSSRRPRVRSPTEIG